MLGVKNTGLLEMNIKEMKLLNRGTLVKVSINPPNSNENGVDNANLPNDSYMRTHNPPRILNS